MPPAPAEGRTPAYGNPYQHAGPSTGHAGYVTDPLRVYSPPAYEAPRYAEPANPAYRALPDPGMTAPPLPPLPAGPVPHADGYAQRPYPGRAARPDGYSAGGYSNGYDAGYAGDPYAGGGYGPYPPRG